MKHVRPLTKRKDMLVLQMDKVKAAGVMDIQEYKDTIKVMLVDEGLYNRLKYDPTRGYKEMLVALLTGLKDQGKISLDQYRGHYPTLAWCLICMALQRSQKR